MKALFHVSSRTVYHVEFFKFPDELTGSSFSNSGTHRRVEVRKFRC